MTDYGVQPTGFVRKPLSVILAEIEASNMTEFGSDVIQTAVSPLGQLNGLFANLISQEWERAENIYQSYDPEQAEGLRLEILGRLRLINRAANESDEDYRNAIMNTGVARIDRQDLTRALLGLAGVTYARVFLVEDGIFDEFQVENGTLAIAVLGGDDADIAATIRPYVVPGIGTFGNVRVSSNIDGSCRSMSIIRPALVPVSLSINVSVSNDRLSCPPPSTVDMRQALATYYATNLSNGDDLNLFRVRALEKLFSTVEVISFVGERDNIESNPVIIGFTELATVAFDDIEINLV